MTDGGTLVYEDVRKFGTMELLRKDQLEAYFAARKLGLSRQRRTFFASFCSSFESFQEAHQTLFTGADLGRWAGQYLCR